jgi:hypothetical protein
VSDNSIRSAADDPADWPLNRFVRGYLGAIPSALIVALALYVCAWDFLLARLGFDTVLGVIAALPAVASLVAMSTMPVGEEASFVHVKIMPVVGAGLRGFLVVATLVMIWGFAAFVMIGSLGMIWSGIRDLIR